MPTFTDEDAAGILQRLLARTIIPIPGGCWVIPGDENAYPNASANGLKSRPHNLSHAIFHPDDPVSPERPYVLHSCDNKRCWNPAHLRAGSPGENVQEAFERGLVKRATCGTYSGEQSHRRRGERICDPCRLAKNTAQNAARQRRQEGLVPKPPIIRKGEDHHEAKLTWDIVREIRTTYAGKRGEQAALAHKYDVAPSVIWSVLAGRTWKEPGA